MNRFIQIIGCLSLLFCSGSLMATDFDGSKPLVCAIVEVLDCGLQDQCDRVNPEFVNLPDIFKINFNKKEMRGGGRTTSFKHLVHEEGNTIIQGVSENGRAWSLLLSKKTGKFTGAVAGIEYGFLLFGSCVLD